MTEAVEALRGGEERSASLVRSQIDGVPVHSQGARLRGGKAVHNLTWSTASNIPVALTAALTQWRQSDKQF